MKKNLFWKMAATALLCAVIVTSCKDIIIDLEETTNITTPQSGYGMVSIAFEGGGIARTITPSEIDISKLYYVLKFARLDGTGDITKTHTGSGQLNLQLPGGIWDLVIRGYNLESDAADTSKALVSFTKNDIVVQYGGTVTINAKLLPHPDKLTQTGSGTLRYNITFPALASGVLKIYTSPENTPVESVVLQAATESRGSMELHSGNYNISVTMEYQGSIKIWTDVVHISDNAITEAVVIPSDFTDYLSSYGNVDISFSIDKFTITDEGAGIFSNESPIILDKSTGDTRIISAGSLIVLEWRVGDVVIGTRSSITLNPVLFPSGTYTLNLVFLKDGKYWLGSIRFEVIDDLSDEGEDDDDNYSIPGSGRYVVRPSTASDYYIDLNAAKIGVLSFMYGRSLPEGKIYETKLEIKFTESLQTIFIPFDVITRSAIVNAANNGYTFDVTITGTQGGHLRWCFGVDRGSSWNVTDWGGNDNNSFNAVKNLTTTGSPDDLNGIIINSRPDYGSATEYTVTITEIKVTPIVKVNAQRPFITAQPQEAVYIQNHIATPLTVTASVTDGGHLSYQWYEAYDYYDRTPIFDARGSSYTPDTSSIGVIYYFVEITNTIPDNGDGGIKSRTTTSAWVSVEVYQGAHAPSINQQPVGGAAYQLNAQSAPLSVNAVSLDGGMLSYQWYKSSEDSNSYGELIAGSTGSTFVPPTNVRGLLYYYCEVTNTIILNSSLTSTMSTRSHTAQIAVGLSPITLSGVTVNTKTYDGTTTATTSGSPVLSGIGGGDNVGINITSVNFSHADAGANIPVVITYQLTGSDANKYFLTNPNLTGTITQAPGSGVTQPTASSVTDNSITVIPVSLLDPTTGQDVEYAISLFSSGQSLTWQWWSTTFTGLNSATTYYVYARSRSDQNYRAGNFRASGAITTLNP